MALNHLHLTVTDVIETARFLKKYLGMKNEWEGYKSKENDKFMALYDGNGFVLILSKVEEGRKVQYPDSFHIGFIQPDRERVNEINRQLKEDGYDVEPPQRHHAYTFYVEAPGGFMIEVLS